MRFTLDDAPWHLDSVSAVLAVEALEALVERLDVVEERGEGICCHTFIYEAPVWKDVSLYALLYERGAPLPLTPDLKRQLGRHLDRIATLKDEHLTALEVVVEGRTLWGPSLAWAHGQCLQAEPTGCVTPATSARRGPLTVGVGEKSARLHFVVDEASHVGFFRDVIVASADEEALERLAASAFPQLCFVDGVWKGLRDFSRPYRDIRHELVHYLAVFSDHGAACFGLDKEPEIVKAFQARNVQISTETRETRADTRCRRARERMFEGELLYFDWHAKIEKHQDRIHVHPGNEKSHQRVIIGILHKHLPLPGD